MAVGHGIGSEDLSAPAPSALTLLFWNVAPRQVCEAVPDLPGSSAPRKTGVSEGRVASCEHQLFLTHLRTLSSSWLFDRSKKQK